MESSLALREEVDRSIDKKVDPVDFATLYLPRMQAALEAAQEPEVANEIRNQIETVKTYIKRELPGTNRSRSEQFEIAHNADMLYLRASARAGALWSAMENKRPEGRLSNSQMFESFIDVMQAGFRSPQDASNCMRLSELDPEDWRTYEEETRSNQRQATINGLVRIWHMLHPKELPKKQTPAEPGTPVDGYINVAKLMVYSALEDCDAAFLMSPECEFYLASLHKRGAYARVRQWAETGCRSMAELLREYIENYVDPPEENDNAIVIDPNNIR